MYPRIRAYRPMPGLLLSVIFDDGKRVVYDVKEDLSLPGYNALLQQTGLFETAQLDTSRTVIFWSDDIDLPSDIIYDYGHVQEQEQP